MAEKTPSLTELHCSLIEKIMSPARLIVLDRRDCREMSWQAVGEEGA
jgi:hypothetical protein